MAKSSHEPFAIVPIGLLDALVHLDAEGGMVKVTPATAVLVYSVLRGVHADRETGLCWPSHDALADRCGLSRRSVIRALDVLREVGAVGWQWRPAPGRGKGTNEYVVLPGPFGPTGHNGNPSRPAPQVTTALPVVTHRPTRCAPQVHPVVTHRAQEPEPMNQSQEPDIPAHVSRDVCTLAARIEEEAGIIYERSLHNVRHPGRPADTKTQELRRDHHDRAVELATLTETYPITALATALLAGKDPSQFHPGYYRAAAS